jgi:enediyne biosynthesis protein E4
MSLRRCYVVLLLSIVLSGCSSKKQRQFSKLPSSQTNISFVNTNTETEQSNILTYEYFYNGGGVAAGDINNDGLADLYFSANNGENKLYLNEGNFRFKDITLSSGTASPNGWKTGVSMVDMNADGWLDIYVCRSGPSQDLNQRSNQLYINNGDLTFNESAWKFRLNDPSYSTQTVFFDFDRDGDLDAFLLNHSLLAISNSYNISQKNTKLRHPYVGNKLLKNEDGKFIDISDSIGIYGPASNYGLGVSLSDINNDGWIDIYAGCDYTGRDRLLLNDHGNFFADSTDSMLSHISKFTMGTDIADVNNDGLMDIYTVDMLPEDNYRQKQLQGSDRYDEYYAMARNGLHHQCMRNMLHLNNGNGTFSEIGQLMNVAATDWSWAALFADFDNDGVQDLFVTNGFKRDLTNNDFAKFQAFNEIKDSRKEGKNVSMLDAIAKFSENKIPSYIFRGRIDSAYQNVTAEWGLSDPSLTNGVVYADLDNDGDLDLVTNNINDAPGIYRNNSEKLSKSNFLRINLRGRDKNTSAIGAKVTVFADKDRFVREQLPVRGFQSGVDPVLHFGLGKYSSVDSVEIRWPDGTIQMQGKMQTNQLLIVTQSASRDEAGVPAGTSLFTLIAEPREFEHKENEFIDFRVQPLLPRMYSHDGPALATSDINDDGISDFFLGGAAGRGARILLGSKDGNFRESNKLLMDADKSSEDIDAIFFDADGDQDDDLYVVTGGYEVVDSLSLLDKLYLNNGKGEFKKSRLPPIAQASSCVRANDVDMDGDLDLFVGGRLVPGKYPSTPHSALLLNDGRGNFHEDLSFSSTFGRLGMVTDAIWTDLNSDRASDLIMVGEWMGVTVLINKGGTFTDQSAEYVQDRTEGLWNCILKHDFDKDGDDDFVIGNQGLNSQMRASASEPVFMIYADFDQNGSIDPIITHFIQGNPYPYPSRDELMEQLPSFKKRFPDYKSYSVANIDNVLTSEEMSKAKKLTVVNTATCYMENANGKLTLKPMPWQLQYAPVYAMALADVNQDGNMDLVTGGNFSSGRARTGRMTGNCGFIFISNGRGEFRFLPPSGTGLTNGHDTRKILAVGDTLVFGVNGGRARFYKLAVP